MSKFKVGDEVASYTYGEGEVIYISANELFPLSVRFNNAWVTFTEDGFFNPNAIRPDLYPSGTTFEVKEPKVRGGWFNLVENTEPDDEFIALYGGKTLLEALEVRKRLSYLRDIYLGPPIYIEAKEGE